MGSLWFQLQEISIFAAEKQEMMIFRESKILIDKEIKLELKQKYVINGILLYLVSTIFITYLAFNRAVDAETWNSLFWIILLFVAVNGISKSFVQESPARHLYYYTISSPQAILISKVVYNLMLMTLLSCLSFMMFLLLMGNMVINISLFLTALLLGSFGLSSVLTMMAAIASRASNNFSLMAILSFPIVLPLLTTLMNVSRMALSSATWSGNWSFIIILLTIDLTVIIMAYLLFPYLWRD